MWGTPAEIETRNRIILTMSAYAYEFENDPIISDGEFDDLCKKINLQIKTGNSNMDKWWQENFDPSTGQWIRKHPELDRINQLCKEYRERRDKTK